MFVFECKVCVDDVCVGVFVDGDESDWKCEVGVFLCV